MEGGSTPSRLTDNRTPGNLWQKHSFLSYCCTMLSVKYHITFWAVAAGAVALYRLLALYSPCVTAFRHVLGPLAAYTAYASFKWPYHRDKRTELMLYVHQVYVHQVLVACLLAALGSVTEYFQLPNEDIPKPTALIHVLLAVFTVSVLESLRQNRPDIEPASFRLIHAGPRTALHHLSWRCMLAQIASLILCNAILFGILLATDRVLREVGGMSLRYIVPYWGWEDIQYRGRWVSAVVSFHLGGPFADMAETVCSKLSVFQ
ncbi:hypothetical protein F5Y03DRAFT_385691 [Xylaria venustula]|nr:hypothetical protein F5Y03DRAFT_385691 [Xylaria venustula]